MNMPGFTAESSLYIASNYYSTIALEMPKSEVLHPQLVLPPWTPCSWLLFCCNEFGNQSCCRTWHLQCVPE